MIRVALGGVLVAAVMSTGALAADLIVEPEIAEAAVAAHDWSGGYIGAHVGYGWGDVSYDFEPPSVLAPVDIPVAGFIAGLGVGFNAQFDQFVLGVEGNVSWAGIEGSVVCPNPIFDCLGGIEWVGDVSLRGGVAFDSVLLFAKAGVAAASVTEEYDPAFMDVGRQTHLGYVVGAGVEVALNESVSVFGEYNYYGLQDVDVPAGGFQTDDAVVSAGLQTVKFGANFHF